MKKSAAFAVLGLALMSAAPALAQPYGPPHGPPPPPGMAPRGWELDRRIDWMQQRIDRGREDGSLDRREARRVQGELFRIRHDEQGLRYRNGGHLNDRDRMMLQDRLDRLNDQIRWMRHNDERRPW